MTSVVAGRAVVLTSTWTLYEEGPLTDLDTSPAVEISRVSDAEVIVAATVAGVTHPAIGTYGYEWTTLATLDAGQYAIEWTGLYLGDPVAAVELIEVTTAGGAAYATPADWDAYPAGARPANLTLLLVRCSRQVDAVLVAAVYDATDADVLVALRDATIEQVLYCLANGWSDGIPAGYEEVQIGSARLKRGAGSATAGGSPASFSSEAFTILQLAGLTGHAVWIG
jgi:hypothetical protein